MSRCVCCNSILDNAHSASGAMINFLPRSEEWCEYCRIMVPCITGQRIDEISSKKDIDRIRRFLGDPGSRPQQIWNRIRDSEGSEGDWCWNSTTTRQERITDHPREWRLLDEDIRYLSNPGGERPPLEQRRRLQIGGILPDGSHLSWASGASILMA